VWVHSTALHFEALSNDTRSKKARRDKNYSLMNLQPLSLVLPLKNTIFIMINENLCVSKPAADVSEKKRLSFMILFVSLAKFMMELFRIDCERVAVFWVGSRA
jgi:hypothetical protein